ncbi:MAG: YicC/YloC family endoribonuclease [Pirellulales bacterium]
MLVSMTGQGQSRRVVGPMELTVEVRAVNNRFFKLQLRTSDSLSRLEPQIEALVRQHVRRGSLNMSVYVSRQARQSDYRLETVAIESYYAQCQAAAAKLGIAADVTLGQLLALPGIVVENNTLDREPSDELTAETLAAVEEALNCLNRMRQTEGAHMAVELREQLERITVLKSTIEEKAPSVIDDYRERLRQRVQQGMTIVGVEVLPADLIRETQIYADKADVREEIVRLRSHVRQFGALIEDKESQGRKLDFLIQEMFREANTIGSKAGDSEIAQRVVDIKAIIEQMRELVQNAE